MKLLLSGDTFLYKHNGKYYTGRADDQNLILRYTEVFEKVRLALRVYDVEGPIENYYLIENPSLEVHEIKGFHGPSEYAKYYFQVRKQLRGVTEGCDCAILRLPSTIGNCVYNRVKKAGLPYATEVVFDSYDGFLNATSWIEKVLWLIIDYDQRAACYGADGVSCVTQYYLQKRYFSKKKEAFTSYYSSLNIPSASYYKPKTLADKAIYTVGHIDNQYSKEDRKGTHEIIKALSIINHANGPKIKMQFVGDITDGAKRKYHNFAKKHNVEQYIEFMGRLNREEIFQFYQSLDMFILPTKAEGLPRVLIEAMASGLPCISTPVSGVPELLQSEWLVDYDDYQKLAERIVYLLDNPSVYCEVSRINYVKSLEYEGSILQKRRVEFMTNLKEKTHILKNTK